LLEPQAIPSTATTSRFVWYDLMSTDREASVAFFREIFGWTVQAIDMGEMGEYQMIFAGEHPFGGAVELGKDDGLPSHWISYVSCEDVDAVAARAEEIGGKIGVPPMDIPDVGRFAVLSDPQGAYFSAIRLQPGAPTAPDSSNDAPAPPGCPIWTELATSDPAAGAAFYADLFGWRIEAMPMGEAGTYRLLGRGAGTPHAGGIMQKTEEMPVSAWTVYFHATDAAATVAKAEELGGTVIAPVFLVPDIGYIAWLQDPTGTVFAIMQPTWKA
jgi:predicted enzyme related to lactoylglutathione lyase